MNTSGVIDFGKRLKDEVSEDDLSGGAAELAYRFFLAIFPFFIFLAALGGFIASAADVQNPTGEIMEMIGDSLPADSANVLRTQLEGVLNQQNAGLLSVGILGAIWASSAGIGALMKRLNQVHGVGESRSGPVRIGLALLLTVLGAGFMVLAFVILFVGQIYGPELAGEIGLQDTAADAINLARWPAALFLVLLAVAFLYWLAPNADLPFKFISPGAVFFAIGWAAATLGFGIYVSNFGSYNETYGALGGVVILMIWFYLTAFLLLLGAEINAVILQKSEEQHGGAVSERAGAATAVEQGRRTAAGAAGRPAATAGAVRMASNGNSAREDEAALSGESKDGEPPKGREQPMGLPGPLGYGLTGVLWALLLIGVMRRSEP